MGSATRCHFVNPKYEELHGQPCYPSLDALPERPDIAVVALNPLRAAMVTEAAAAAGVPAVIIPGGGVVEGGPAAAAMQVEVARIAREHGIVLVGPNCMGVIDLVANSATYIGDVSPYLPRGGVAGIAQSGSVTDAFVHSGSRVGFSRIISCGSEVVVDICDYLAYCLDDPETTSVILFVEGFKRPERFLALADRALELGKPIMAVKVGRSDQAQEAAVAHSGSLAGEARITDAALDAAGRHPLRRPRRAPRDRRARRGHAADGPLRRSRPDRASSPSRPARPRSSPTRRRRRASTCRRSPSRRGPRSSRRSRRWATSATRSTRGAPTSRRVAYGAVFEAMAASGAYDVLALVHDFPYRSLASEVATANDVTHQLLAATRDRPEILPVYVSLTSGEPPPETKALLDAEGDGAPLLRGGLEAFTAIAETARWTGRRDLRRAVGPWRGGWPALAADRTSYGADPAPLPPPARTRSGALRAREPRVPRGRRDRRPPRPWPVPDAAGAVDAARRLGGPVALKLEAADLWHKSEVGGVALGLHGDERRPRGRDRDARLGATPPGSRSSGLLVEPMAAPGVELILGLQRDPLFGSAVLVGLGGVLAEVLDDVAIRLAPVTPRAAMSMLDDLRGRALLDGVRGRPGHRSRGRRVDARRARTSGRRSAGRPRGRPQPGHRVADGRHRRRRARRPRGGIRCRHRLTRPRSS